jgi:hypothetical protein
MGPAMGATLEPLLSPVLFYFAHFFKKLTNLSGKFDRVADFCISTVVLGARAGPVHAAV